MSILWNSKDVSTGHVSNRRKLYNLRNRSCSSKLCGEMWKWRRNCVFFLSKQRNKNGNVEQRKIIVKIIEYVWIHQSLKSFQIILIFSREKKSTNLHLSSFSILASKENGSMSLHRLCLNWAKGNRDSNKKEMEKRLILINNQL